VLLWPFFIVKPPEFNLTKDDRQAFSGLHLHLQPDGSFQQAMFTQLVPSQVNTNVHHTSYFYNHFSEVWEQDIEQEGST